MLAFQNKFHISKMPLAKAGDIGIEWRSVLGELSTLVTSFHSADFSTSDLSSIISSFPAAFKISDIFHKMPILGKAGDIGIE